MQLFAFVFFFTLFATSTTTTAFECPDWSSLTNGELFAAVEPRCFSIALSGDLAQIPNGEVCKYFTGYQAGNLSISVPSNCIGITPACAGNMSLEGASHLNGVCLAAFSDDTISALSSAQVAVILPTSLANGRVLSRLEASCAGLTQAQIQFLSEIAPESVKYLTSNCAKELSLEALESFADISGALVTPEFLGGLSATQVHVLPPGIFTAFNDKQLSAFRDSCAGITAVQAEQLAIAAGVYSNSCQGLTEACAAAITPAGLSGLTGNCAMYIHVDFVRQLSAEQVHALQPNTLAALGYSLRGLNTSCSGIRKEQTHAMTGTCQYLTDECAVAMTFDAISRFSTLCAAMLSRGFVEALNATQVSALSPDAFGALDERVLPYLSSSCAGLNSSHTSHIPMIRSNDKPAVSGCSFLSYDCARAMTPEALSGLSPVCAEYLPPSIASAFSAQQIGALQPTTFSELILEGVALLQETCSGITAEQMKQLGGGPSGEGSNCQAFTPRCASSLSLDAVSNIQPGCLRAVSAEFMRSLYADQVTAIPAPSFAGLHLDNIRGLLSCEKLTRTQVSYLAAENPRACGGLEQSCLQLIPPKSFAGFRNDCTVDFILEDVQEYSILMMTPKALGGLPAIA